MIHIRSDSIELMLTEKDEDQIFGLLWKYEKFSTATEINAIILVRRSVKQHPSRHPNFTRQSVFSIHPFSSLGEIYV
jgi:hypothetical protein